MVKASAKPPPTLVKKILKIRRLILLINTNPKVDELGHVYV